MRAEYRGGRHAALALAALLAVPLVGRAAKLRRGKAAGMGRHQAQEEGTRSEPPPPAPSARALGFRQITALVLLVLSLSVLMSLKVAPPTAGLPRVLFALALGAAGVSLTLSKHATTTTLQDDVLVVPALAPTSTFTIEGEWLRDRAASDPMDDACDAIHLNGLLRKALVLINGLSISFEGDDMRLSLTSVIPFYRITEVYTTDGHTVTRCRRRDLRPGGHVGTAHLTRDGGVDINVRWGAPHGGSLVDALRVTPDGNTLVLTSSMAMDDGTNVTYRTLYRRRKQ